MKEVKNTRNINQVHGRRRPEWKEKTIRFTLQPNAKAPEYAYGGSKENSGLDLCAYKVIKYPSKDITDLTVEGTVAILNPGERCLVQTGVNLKLFPGLEGQVRSRSGLALKNGIIVLNSPGTIDSSYTGDVGVILYNAGEEPFEIKLHDKIAQLVFMNYVPAKLIKVDTLTGYTQRGNSGFGSTGV